MVAALSADPEGPKALTDADIVRLVEAGKIASYALEKVLRHPVRAVKIRRTVICTYAAACERGCSPAVDCDLYRTINARASLSKTLEHSSLPLDNYYYDYAKVLGACCENVVGFLPLPLGIAGPLLIDGRLYHISMATTEGCLAASTSRGCKAITASGGARTVLVADAMTRGPVVEMPNVARAAELEAWLEDCGAGQAAVKEAFESTSRFARLRNVKVALAGRLVFVRFSTATGDAMGMNMISK
ncbi:MAG: 3-hydroxy-3-methylglutaryl-CoA reductase, partial [Olpidium bornovanus]